MQIALKILKKIAPSEIVPKIAPPEIVPCVEGARAPSSPALASGESAPSAH